MSNKTIQEAKLELEKEIISLNDVFGLGTVFDGNDYFIEVAVGNERTRKEIKKFVPDGKWHGHSVKIVIREQTKF